MKHYTLDDKDVYTLFSTLSDMEVFQHRIENILKHIAGFELSEREKERHEDKSYEERVRIEYQSYFGCTPKVFDRPELKLIKPHVEVWEKKEAEA